MDSVLVGGLGWIHIFFKGRSSMDKGVLVASCDSCGRDMRDTADMLLVLPSAGSNMCSGV